MADTSVALSFGQLLTIALAPAIITGVVSVVASMFGPSRAEASKQRAEDRKRRAEKFEELVANLYEHKHWITLAKDIRVFDASKDLGVSPIGKIRAIATAYFPSLHVAVLSFDAAAAGYEAWMFGARVKKLNNIPQFNSGFEKPWADYLAAFAAVEAELKRIAENELMPAS
jgi:hypothetical protein